MTPLVVFTIGHSTRALEEFIRLLNGRVQPLPKRHRGLERLDADAHFVAVLDAVVDVEAVDR